MLAAVALRIIAVIFSKGFMATDDHYETVEVAYWWLRNGFFNDVGDLMWGKLISSDITRHPIYNLFVYTVMWGHHQFGAVSLDALMYSQRAVHALLSLIPIWAVYDIVRRSTRSITWAVAAGLIMAAHFGMPFLAVRNLIEMVGGHVFMVVIWLLYRYEDNRAVMRLYWAGLLTVLAWTVRFQMPFAALPIPFVLWWQYRSLRPALHFTAAIIIGLTAAGMIDWLMLGGFHQSTINQIHQAMTTGPVYHAVPYVYLAEILAFFIPPFSLIAFGAAFSRQFFRRHALLILCTLSFVIIHTVLSNRQERFMIPMLPELTLIAILALWHHFSAGGFFFRHRKWFTATVVLAVVVNVVLLVPFTLWYAHRGLVEPLVRLEQRTERAPVVMWVTPEKNRLLPNWYLGWDLKAVHYLWSWGELKEKSRPEVARTIDYFIVLPPHDRDRAAYVDSLETYFGPLHEEFYVGPSTVDHILHRLNPKYNPTNAAWVYRRGGGARTK